MNRTCLFLACTRPPPELFLYIQLCVRVWEQGGEGEEDCKSSAWEDNEWGVCSVIGWVSEWMALCVSERMALSIVLSFSLCVCVCVCVLVRVWLGECVCGKREREIRESKRVLVLPPTEPRARVWDSTSVKDVNYLAMVCLISSEISFPLLGKV